MNRDIRYQGAIVRDGRMLLIRERELPTGHTYWLIPGGREEGETGHECVVREMKEETQLDVAVDRLLLDDPAPPGGPYQRLRTYLCTPIGGEARPGSEPEPEAAGLSEMIDVGWFDLRDESTWGDQVSSDPITFPLLRRISATLGYGGNV